MNGFSFKDLADLCDEPIQEVKLDLEAIKANVCNFTNEKLCEMVVADRYLGFEQAISAICMTELGKRRAAGDTFNFEAHISSISKDLPVLDFSAAPISDFGNVLKKMITERFGK